jgi:hypothetical protein
MNCIINLINLYQPHKLHKPDKLYQPNQPHQPDKLPQQTHNTMNDLLKNPIATFLLGLLGLWLLFYFLKVVVNLFWLFLLAFIVLYFLNARFRRVVRNLLSSIFK